MSATETGVDLNFLSSIFYSLQPLVVVVRTNLGDLEKECPEKTYYGFSENLKLSNVELG